MLVNKNVSKETTVIFEICIFYKVKLIVKANRSEYFTTLTDKLSLFALKVLSNEIAPNYHVVHIFV